MKTKAEILALLGRALPYIEKWLESESSDPENTIDQTERELVAEISAALTDGASTPRPWAVERGFVVHPASERSICHCHLHDEPDFAEDDANAELIVRAVNSHDGLVSALERLVEVVGHNSCTDGRTPNGFVVAP